MKSRKVIFVLIVIFLTRLVTSCCRCDEPGKMHYFFDTISVHNLDNSGEYDCVSTSEYISKEAFGLQIELTIKKESNHFRPRSINFSAANATSCECVYEQYLPKDTISSLSVFTVNDFDGKHIAESDISPYFKVVTPNGFISINEYLKLPETIYENWLPEKEQITLYLLQSPTNLEEKHSFKVEIGFSNGELVSLMSKPVYLE